MYLSPVLFESYGDDKVKSFGFSSKEFDQLDYIIGRAGLGTITECIKYRIPFLALSDDANTELVWNGKRITELGIGFVLKNGVKDIAINSLINKRNKFLENIQKRPLNGEKEILDFLIHLYIFSRFLVS